MSQKNFQCLRVDEQNGVTVVKFLDDKIMDPARIEQIGGEFVKLTEGNAAPNLIVNFGDVKFFSSAAINKLIVLEKRMRAKGGQIRLSNLRPEVRDLFGFTHLDTLFKIHSTQEDAEKDLASQP